jgi:transposase
MIIHPNIIGIDVCKAHFDIFDAERGRPERLPNRAEAAHALADRLAARQDGFAIFEATGDYDRHLRGAFDARAIVYARVNPQQARDFARAMGRRAKSDALDARMLARMAQALELAPTPARDALRDRVAALHRRRDQLIEHRAAEKARLKEGNDPDGSITRHLTWLNTEIAHFDRLIAEAIENSPALTEQADLMRSVPGVGPVAATTLIALMPELGTLSPRTAAALAGLAPYDNDSGLWRGVRRIGGGRRRVRRALYMAALAAARSQSSFKRFYQALRARNKPAKVALTALARKLIIVLNAILRDKMAFQG